MKIWRICLCVLLLLAAGLAQARYDQVEYFHLIERDDVNSVRTALLQGQFNANTFSQDGFSALYLALREPSPKVADLLIEQADTQLNLENAWGENALMMAAMRGLMPQAVRMMELGAEVNKKGWAPLHYAASAGQADMIRLLLANYAYIDAQSPTGETPLMMAAARGNPESVQLLLDAEADTSLRNKKRQTAVDMALERGNSNNAQRIRTWVARGGQPTPPASASVPTTTTAAQPPSAPTDNAPSRSSPANSSLPIGSGSAQAHNYAGAKPAGATEASTTDTAPKTQALPEISTTQAAAPPPAPEAQATVSIQPVPPAGSAQQATEQETTNPQTHPEPALLENAGLDPSPAEVAPAEVTPLPPRHPSPPVPTLQQQPTSMADIIAAPVSRAMLQILSAAPQAAPQAPTPPAAP